MEVHSGSSWCFVCYECTPAPTPSPETRTHMLSISTAHLPWFHPHPYLHTHLQQFCLCVLSRLHCLHPGLNDAVDGCGGLVVGAVACRGQLQVGGTGQLTLQALTPDRHNLHTHIHTYIQGAHTQGTHTMSISPYPLASSLTGQLYYTYTDTHDTRVALLLADKTQAGSATSSDKSCGANAMTVSVAQHVLQLCHSSSMIAAVAVLQLVASCCKADS